MAYQYWSYETLKKFCMEAFQKFGFNEKEADIIQDVLLTSDLFGIESHGMQRMVRPQEEELICLFVPPSTIL